MSARARSKFILLATALGGVSLMACASTKTSSRMVEDPVGEAISYGPPEKLTYVAELDAGREYGRVVVFQSARCAVIPVTVMQTYRETSKGDKVIERSPVSKKQVAQPAEGSIPCDQTYAINIEVMLEAGGDRFSLGKTDAKGEVGANLAQVFKVGSLEEIPPTAKIMIRPEGARPLVEAGQVSLAQLQKYGQRVQELLAKLEEIFALDAAALKPEDITRSYELYAQLQDFAAEDPRVQAISSRFWELLDGRKRDEAQERLGKNLEALSEARATLKVMGDAAIPIYVQAAVNSGTMNRRALEWSSLRLLRALRGAPAVCRAGFAWGSVPSYGWPADARLASQYVHYGYGGAHAKSVQHACRAF